MKYGYSYINKAYQRVTKETIAKLDGKDILRCCIKISIYGHEVSMNDAYENLQGNVIFRGMHGQKLMDLLRRR